jgi:Immunity protein 49
MKIERHPIDLENTTRVFKLNLGRLDSSLEAARRAVNNLYSLFLTGKNVYYTGSVIAPDSPEVARALRLAARASTAIFVFAQLEDPPRYFSLGEGPPVTYPEPSSESCVELSTWQKAYYLAMITRQRDLLDELCQTPVDLLRRSSTGPRDREGLSYRLIELFQFIGREEHFTQHPVFVEWEAFCTSGPGGSAPGIVAYLGAPLLRVLKQFERRDEVGFNNALTEALQLHKKYWSSKEKLRKDFEGLVSLPLTAVAALAWDRGMRFDVESDYMPRSWVTGELFTRR